MDRFTLENFCRKLVSSIDKVWKYSRFDIEIKIGHAATPAVYCRSGLSSNQWFCVDVSLPFFNELVDILEALPLGINLVQIRYDCGHVEYANYSVNRFLGHTAYYSWGLNAGELKRFNLHLNNLKLALQSCGRVNGIATLYEEKGTIYLKGTHNGELYSGFIKDAFSKNPFVSGICSNSCIRNAIYSTVEELSKEQTINQITFTTGSASFAHGVKYGCAYLENSSSGILLSS